MKCLKDFSFKGKTALVRCDFNVSFSEDNEILDDYRIRSSISTIKYLIEEGAKVILINHLTNPKNEEARLSLIHLKAEELLGQKISLIKDCKEEKSQKAVKKGSSGDIFLFGNVRQNKEEEENSKLFAEKISSFGDIYVNDAFSVCHREHASVVGLPKILPSCAGLQLCKETKILSKVISSPWRPLVVIIGGAKVSSKIKSLNNFLKIADHLLLGGKLVNEILKIKGIILREVSLPEETLERVKNIELTSPKIHFPVDVIVSPDLKGETYTRITGPGLIRKDEDIFDIGPETVKIYSEVIKDAQMIIWAGPLGLSEEKKFEKGTKEIVRAILTNHKAFKIIGGGDTGVALKRFGNNEAIDHISTGGGAMLNFLSGEKLPGLEALGYYNN